MGLHQNFKLLRTKDTIKKVKRQPKEQGKIFANHMYDKGLLSRKYKELRQLNSKKSTQFKNGQRTQIDFFNIISCQRNAKQNHNEIALHTH